MYAHRAGPVVVDFRRDPSTGRLAHIQHHSNRQHLAVSPDSENLYGASEHALTVFTRTALCPDAPLPSCHDAATGTLLLRDDTVEKRNRVSLRWSGDASLASFGNPTATSSYAVCIYDQTGGSPTSVVTLLAPTPKQCVKGAPCWKLRGSTSAPKGYKYYDFYRAPTGMRQMTLIPGSAGSSRLTAMAYGPLVPLTMSAPLVPPVQAQIVNTLGECWQVTFAGTDIKRNTSTPVVPLNFRARR